MPSMLSVMVLKNSKGYRRYRVLGGNASCCLASSRRLLLSLLKAYYGQDSKLFDGDGECDQYPLHIYG